jgi:predicted helicase
LPTGFAARPFTPKRKKPLPHQSEALEAILAGLDEHDRVTAVMACATGKTLVALWLAERKNAERILVLVPSLMLVRQTLHEWLKETDWEQPRFIAVCSDPTVRRGVDPMIVHQRDLDFPVTTDKAEVREFLAAPGDAVQIVFSTYDSAHVVGEACRGINAFDLGIFDEAHKTAGREGAKCGFALEDGNLPIEKRVFLTATPRHYDLRKKDKEGDKGLVYSMDQPATYGPFVYTLSFAKAAERGIICNYKIIISIVTSEMINADLLSRGEVPGPFCTHIEAINCGYAEARSLGKPFLPSLGVKGHGADVAAKHRDGLAYAAGDTSGSGVAPALFVWSPWRLFDRHNAIAGIQRTTGATTQSASSVGGGQRLSCQIWT